METESSPQVLSFLQSEGVALLWLPVAISKLFLSWVGKRSLSNGIHAFGAGIEGTSEKQCQRARPHSAGSREETEDQNRQMRAGRPSTLGCAETLRPPGDLFRRCQKAAPLLESSASPEYLLARPPLYAPALRSLERR